MKSKRYQFALILCASTFLLAPAQADTLPALRSVDGEDGVRFIIPSAQLGNYVRGFNVETSTDSNGVDHARLIGWVPNECKEHIVVRMGHPDQDQIFDSEHNAYPMYVYARAITRADGVSVRPDECFTAHRATACNLSRNPADRNCTALSEVAADISTNALSASGDVIQYVESTELDPRGTGDSLPSLRVRTLVHYTGSTEISNREEQDRKEALCTAAATGDRSAIEDLRQMAGMVSIANYYESQADEQEFQDLMNVQITDLNSAQRAAQELHAFATAHRDYRVRAAEALLQLATYVSENIEAGENDNATRFGTRSLDLRQRILGFATSLGARGARLASDRLVLDRLRFTAQHPNRDASNYTKARQAAERLTSQRGPAYRNAVREAESRAEERPYTSLYLDAQRALSPYSQENTDNVARQSWYQNATHGEYSTNRSSGSSGYGTSFYYGASMNQSTYSPYAMPMPYTYY